jgi:serine/threonine protein kinase
MENENRDLLDSGPRTVVSPAEENPQELTAGRVADEMAQAWRSGRKIQVEEYLVRFPILRENSDAILRLLCEEICLRQEAGEEVTAEEFFARFPEWQEEVRGLLESRVLPDDRSSQISSFGKNPSLRSFHHIKTLGRGSLGRVFLATEPELGNRPVVVKISSCRGQEHLSLARLQHTHIMPLYWVHDDPQQDQRVLCMPFYGSLTLAGLAVDLHEIPPEQRTGQHIVAALEKAQLKIAESIPAHQPQRQHLARLSYEEAICWIGECLASALHYAHERGLVHLDLKPANVLLTTDGLPMLLDFHLAREPVIPGGPRPLGMGGTPIFMSPEQKAALEALGKNQPVPALVDGRSDIYSLGLLLFLALEARLPAGDSVPGSLQTCNRKISVGFADIIRKCLAKDPGSRYPDAESLALDLRRHREHLPLRGVPNRSLSERWRKWRRRQPYAFPLLIILAALFGVTCWAGFTKFAQIGDRRRTAEMSLYNGQEFLSKRQYSEAEATLAHGLVLAQDVPGGAGLVEALKQRLQLTRRAQKAQELRTLVDYLRFYFLDPSLPSRRLHVLEASCRNLWDARNLITDSSAGTMEQDLEQTIRADLQDMVILWAELHVLLAPQGQAKSHHQEALQRVGEGEEFFGPSALFQRVRQKHFHSHGLTAQANQLEDRIGDFPPPSGWEHTAMAGIFLRSQEWDKAHHELVKAVRLHRQAFWPNFYLGVCTFHQKDYVQAVSFFSFCAGQSAKAEPYYFRALAYAAANQPEKALEDFDQALRLDGTLGAAYWHRGALNYDLKRLTEALADFQQALKNGADPCKTNYQLALVQVDQGNWNEARHSLHNVLREQPEHPKAKELLLKIP